MAVAVAVGCRAEKIQDEAEDAIQGVCMKEEQQFFSSVA
jgi:hypothetical protein